MSPAGHGARGIREARDQAPFPATDLFQAPANYPDFTWNSKFHLIQFKFQCRSLKSKHAGGWGPGASAARCCAGTALAPGCLGGDGGPQAEHVPRERPPEGDARPIPAATTQPSWQALEHGSAGRSSRWVHWLGTRTGTSPPHAGSRYSRRSSAKSAFSPMTNLLL